MITFTIKNSVSGTPYSKDSIVNLFLIIYKMTTTKSVTTVLKHFSLNSTSGKRNSYFVKFNFLKDQYSNFLLQATTLTQSGSNLHSVDKRIKIWLITSGAVFGGLRSNKSLEKGRKRKQCYLKNNTWPRLGNVSLCVQQTSIIFLYYINTIGLY